VDTLVKLADALQVEVCDFFVFPRNRRTPSSYVPRAGSGLEVPVPGHRGTSREGGSDRDQQVKTAGDIDMLAWYGRDINLSASPLRSSEVRR
jgi:hypothetical protein